MNSSLKYLSVFVFFCSIFGISENAHAFPGQELMDKFSPLERKMYIKALVDMASYHAAIDDNQERAKCINVWFFEPDHKKSVAYVEKAFVKFPDMHAARIVVAIINQKCGKPPNWPS